MIRLIATDMDNTLVYPDKQLPLGIFPLIRRLARHGIVFAPASARHYNNLFRMFEPAGEPMAYICDNGAYGEYQGKAFVREALGPEQVDRIVRVCESIPGVSLSLCARNAMYYRVPPPFFTKEDEKPDGLFRMLRLEDLRQAPEPVYRAALYDPANPLCHSLPILRETFGEELSVTATDDVSVDLMKPGVNKGTGLEALQQLLGITPAETMAFGDYYNDLEMLGRAEYSFAVANAIDGVKACCRYTTESNAEEGVLRAIERYLDEQGLE